MTERVWAVLGAAGGSGPSLTAFGEVQSVVARAMAATDVPEATLAPGPEPGQLVVGFPPGFRSATIGGPFLDTVARLLRAPGTTLDPGLRVSVTLDVPARAASSLLLRVASSELVARVAQQTGMVVASSEAWHQEVGPPADGSRVRSGPDTFWVGALGRPVSGLRPSDIAPAGPDPRAGAATTTARRRAGDVVVTTTIDFGERD